ncbi:hypothetical protein KA005_59310 [bacterium]|nr:hypothetical protein [bacterium]
MRKLFFNCLLGLFFCLPAGCALQPIRLVVVKGTKLEGRADIPLIDPNDPNSPYTIEFSQEDNGNRMTISQPKGGMIKLKRTCRIKYSRLYNIVTPRIVIEGKVKRTGKKYPIAVDTGCVYPLVVHDIHVQENKLAILPLVNGRGDSIRAGFCYLPELQIGKMTLVNLLCCYKERHAELQVFGLPIARVKEILLGLDALKGFKYILFDGISKEVEFSPKSIFEPETPSLWSRYSFAIKKGLLKQDFIFVKIPIAGEEMELIYDTAGGCGLLIRERVWKNVRKSIPNVKLKTSALFVPARGGWISCKKVVIRELYVGKRKVKNAIVSVVPNDSQFPDFQNCQGLLGMQYFRDTIIVLDFERNLMWVKNK